MIELYTSPTPNGHKVSIALEEMDLSYSVRPINLLENEQKQAQYLKINPNGRIPTIIDRDCDDFVVFESGAILIYLAEKSGRFMPGQKRARFKVLEWLMFQMGGVGPMMGQANVFLRYFPEKIQPVIDRYQNEVKRLLGVLDTRLAHNEFLAGDYSIADMANYAWVRTAFWSGVEHPELEHLNRWLETISLRPAVQKGIEIPPKPTAEQIEAAGKEIIVE